MATEAVLDDDRQIPWLFECAAAIEGEPVADLYTDPGVIARSLSGAADLFGLPAVSVSFDTTLEAEAAGCTVDASEGAPSVIEGCVGSIDDAFDVPITEIDERGRVPTFLEAVERLQASVGDTVVCGGITGPNRLTDHLLVEPEDAAPDLEEEALFTAGDLGAELASAYLDAGADAIAVLEPEGIDREFYADPATAITNVLDHYEVPGVLVTGAITTAEIERAAEFGFDAVTGRVEDPDAAIEAAGQAGIALGVGIPRDRFEAGPDAVESFVDDLPAGAQLSSEWTVPTDTAPEALHGLMGSQ
jgi:uroporphyrinogen-III decarboxylase